MKLKKGFLITVSPVQVLDACSIKVDQEKRGLFGFHDFTHCTDCSKHPNGFELWGENGHRQGTFHGDHRGLADLLKYRYRLRNERFRRGSMITLQGRNK